ncbi:MAG: tetratricopeptide repeat protein [Gammaproteobacteria bacterium]|nr:tetratricopeptide repeat protein [Gammaproteobacteria bacterium]
MFNDETLYQAILSADEKNQIGYARFLCERYLKNHPNHAPTLVIYACNLISLSQYSEAEAALDRAEPITPKDKLPFVIAQRGHLLVAKGDFVGAERIFMKAHELDPDDATFLIYAGSSASQNGDIERAETLARQATNCAKGCLDEAWYNLGGYLVSKKMYGEAAECYRQALLIDPEYEIAI